VTTIGASNEICRFEAPPSFLLPPGVHLVLDCCTALILNPSLAPEPFQAWAHSRAPRWPR
jgi:hypothetical protein